MSDFSVSQVQRQRLLAGDYRTPLDFDTKPYELEPGAVYVLAWTGGPSAWEDGYGIRRPKVPVWYITVTAVQRHRKGFWRARFDVTDNRDPDLWLSHHGDYQPTPAGAVDVLSVAPSDEVRAKAVAEFEHQRKLARFAAEQRKKWAAKRKRAA